MKYIIILAISIFSYSIYADDCDLDQIARVIENKELKKKYPGSYLIENNLILVVPDQYGKAKVNIGGCVHFGVTIDLVVKNPEKHKSEKDFMNMILYLAQTYSQGMINSKKLEQVINERNWMQPEPPSKFYFFNYDGSPFEVYESEENGKIIIGFRSYS